NRATDSRRLANALDRAPVLLTLQLRAAILHEALQNLEWCLAAFPPTRAQLDGLAAVWVEESPAVRLRDYWQSEVSGWWELPAERLIEELNQPGVDKVVRPNVTVPDEFKQVPGLATMAQNVGKPNGWGYWWDEPADRLAFLEKVQRYDILRSSSLHTMGHKAATIDAASDAIPLKLFRARLSLGNPQDVVKAVVRSVAYARLAQSAIAIERYRLASGP